MFNMKNMYLCRVIRMDNDIPVYIPQDGTHGNKRTINLLHAKKTMRTFLRQKFTLIAKLVEKLSPSVETSLLNEDLLNTHRDFVFFAEKNRAGAYSEYTRADEYGLHKNLSLYKSYRNGRLGAVPQLGSPLLYLEDDEEN